MAFEPINVFSRKVDPQGVISTVRQLGLDVQVTGPEDDWETLVILGRKKFLRKRLALTLTHSSEYYDSPNWPKNVFGMRNYFASFPNVPRKEEVLRAILSFRFAISAVATEDLDIDSPDERLEWLSAICKHLDGMIFTPSGMRDAAGRIALGNGKSDPKAVLPEIPSTIPFPELEDSDLEDEEFEPTPPSAERVLRRAMVLAAVTNRAFIEMENAPREEMEELRSELLEWIEETGISDEVEPDEWEVLQLPVGSVPQQSTIDSAWRLEGLGVLAWALKLHPLPAYDELVVTADVQRAVGLYDAESALELQAAPDLRTAEELEELGTRVLGFNWRMVNFRVHPGKVDFVTFSKDCWFGGFDISHFRIVDGDLAIGNVAISDADPDDVSRCQSAAQERHRAINWLSGYDPIYSQVDTST